MNEDLKKQAADQAAAPEGTVPASVPYLNFDKQTKIVQNGVGYLVEKISRDKETGEQKSTLVQISDFIVEPVRVERFADRDSKTVQRVVRLVNPELKCSVEAIVQSKDLASRYNFKCWARDQGPFNFWGSEDDIDRIAKMVCSKDGDEVLLKNISGLDIDTDHWIFANSAISKDGVVTQLDKKKGYIPVENEKYRLAANDKDTKVIRAPTLKCGVEPKKAEALLRTVIDKTIKLWGPGAEIGWAWFLAILWRSKWMEETEQFPMLFVTGNPSIGKTQFVKECGLKLYGISMDPLSIAKVTPVGLYSITNSLCNIPLFLDEFKSDMLANPEIMEMLKGNADNSARTVGTTDIFQTITRIHRTGYVIVGESRPTDEALASRNVSADLVKNNQRALFLETINMCRDLSCAIIPYIQQWKDLWTLILQRSNVLAAEWTPMVKLDSRIVTNYSKVCATMDVLLSDETRKGRFFAAMTVKGEEMENKNPLAKLLEALPYLIREKKAFIPCIVNLKKKILAVNASFLILRCAEHWRLPVSNARDLIRNGKIANLLIPGHRDIPHQVEIEDFRDGKRRRANSRCFVFDMNHPLAREVGECLVDQDTPACEYQEPSNPDDPFVDR